MVEGIVGTGAVSPLAGHALASDPPVATLAEATVSGRIVLRAGPEAARRIMPALGCGVPGRINTAIPGESCTALRLGPDEWLLLADAERDPWLAARIGEAAGGEPVAVVDVSHRNAGIEIVGPAVEDVLSAGCPLPLDATAFPVGRATRTLLAKSEIVLWRRAPEHFHLEIARSFALYAAAFLAEAIANEAAIRRQGRL